MSSHDTLQNIQKLETSLYLASAYMLSNAAHEDVAIFIGTSKSGKSSLINYLIGNKLIGKKFFSYKPPLLQKGDDSIGPQIGIQSTSETVIPTRYNSQKISGLVVWDAPGFDDNRGVIQDITNAFYICELFKHIKSAKIILVIDINDIKNDNIRPTLSLLKAVNDLLQDRMADCFVGIAIIFTKVPDVIHDARVDRSLIAHILNEQLLSSDSIEISRSAKDFISYLTTSVQNIGLFKQATVGIVTDDIENGVLEAIRSVEGISESILKQVTPSIAENSKVFLYEAREQLSSMKMFVELQELIETVLTAKLSEVETKPIENFAQTELITLSEILCITKDKMVRALDDAISFYSKIDTVKSLDMAISNFIDQHDLCRKAQFMEFIDKLLAISESHNFHICLQNILVAGRQKVDELLILIKLNLGKIQKKEADQQLASLKKRYDSEINRLENEMQKLKDENERNKFKSPFIGVGGKRPCTIL